MYLYAASVAKHPGALMALPPRALDSIADVGERMALHKEVEG